MPMPPMPTKCSGPMVSGSALMRQAPRPRRRAGVPQPAAPSGASHRADRTPPRARPYGATPPRRRSAASASRPASRYAAPIAPPFHHRPPRQRRGHWRSDDHQTANARAFAAAGGGEMVAQSALHSATLAEKLMQLIDDGAALRRMAGRAAAFGRPDATRRLAQLAVALLPGAAAAGLAA